jgi:ABC-type sugar transport system ATPase subunit
VAIARAVYWQAKLMIMDEATNNLGVVEQHKVLDLISKLREEQGPVILIGHTLAEEAFEAGSRSENRGRGREGSTSTRSPLHHANWLARAF